MLCRSLVLVVAGLALPALPALLEGSALASRPQDGGGGGGGRDRGRMHPRARPLPAIEMQHLTTHETFVLRPDEKGRLGGKRLRGLRHFLRCHHTGREHAMAPRLAELLYATAHHFGDRPITVIAGYRAPRVARKKGNTRSPHKKGVACDFRVEGIKVTDVRDFVRRAFQGVGVGYYPNSGFIHLDVGRKQSAFWIDYSGPGERADYSADPDGDIRSGAADPSSEEGDAEASLPQLPGDAAEAGATDGARATDGSGAASAKAAALRELPTAPAPIGEAGATSSPPERTPPDPGPSDRTPIE